MDVVFCHGLESAPHGRKYHALKDAGLPVRAPDFQGLDLAARVAALEPILRDAAEPPVLVGSSYGGITAVCAALRTGAPLAGLVLCAPALERDEPPANAMQLRAPCPTIVIHGTGDQVIPIAVSRRFAAGDDRVALVEVDDDHSLAGSLALIVAATRSFVDGLPFRR
jgi:pimeloyl-ACP methyl ester carboxylesterase